MVADGFCPGCGQPAPLTDYLQLIQQRGGLLVLDDTQALGILGHSPSAQSAVGELEVADRCASTMSRSQTFC